MTITSPEPTVSLTHTHMSPPPPATTYRSILVTDDSSIHAYAVTPAVSILAASEHTLTYTYDCFADIWPCWVASYTTWTRAGAPISFLGWQAPVPVLRNGSEMHHVWPDEGEFTAWRTQACWYGRGGNTCHGSWMPFTWPGSEMLTGVYTEWSWSGRETEPTGMILASVTAGAEKLGVPKATDAGTACPLMVKAFC